MSESDLIDALDLVATALLGLAALAFSIVTWIIGWRAEREARDDQLLAWSNRGIDVMARIEALSRLEPKVLTPAQFYQLRSSLAAEASAVLDQGRIFFPNVKDEGRAIATDGGLRPRILDELRVAYLVAQELSPTAPKTNERRGLELWAARGRFVGYLREAVGDVRKRKVVAATAGRSVQLEMLPGESELLRTPAPVRPHRR